MGRSECSRSQRVEEARLHVARWLGSERKKLDVCLFSDAGEIVGEFPVPPDADGLAALVRRVGPESVRAVIESMTGARFVHDRLEELGWDVLIADAQKAKGIAPLACKTDKIDARVLAVFEPSWF